MGGHRSEDVAFAQNYARLCDGLLRDTKRLFTGVPADKLHEVFVVMSRIKVEAESESKVTARLVNNTLSAAAAAVDCPVSTSSSIWAALSNEVASAKSNMIDNEDLYI